jgi:hypothetical protein
MSRNQDIETGFHRSLMWVFVVHSSLFAGVLVKEGVTPGINSTREFDIMLVKVIIMLEAFLNFWGALIGILALLSRYIPS